MKKNRKLQISNGHYIDFDQIARLIYAITTADQEQKITLSFLEEDIGLPFRQIRNRVSIIRAMGLFEKKTLQLSFFGNLIAKYDPFFEIQGSLEYVHYLAAGDYNNLIWFEVFNTLLPDEQIFDYPHWLDYFRKKLEGHYSEKSLKGHVSKEVRFIIEAYTKSNLKQLELFSKNSQERIYKRRYLDPSPLIFCAILYDYAQKQKTDLLQVKNLLQEKGSPPVLFFMGKKMLHHIIEILHEKCYLRYEGTHDLNQLRLREGYNAESFLTAYYEDREPVFLE